MMKQSLWRFLLTCLLLVALPSQGFAAASMAACGPNHHQRSESMSQARQSTVVASHHEMNEASHHHASADGNHTHSSVQKTSHLADNFKCKNCAPCCVGAAPSRDVSMHIAAPISESDFPSITFYTPLPLIGGLDRPPRNLLA